MLLLVVGSIGRGAVSRARRLSAFRVEDYDLLVRIVESFRELVATPHVLTEVSNLLGYEKAPLSEHGREILARLTTVLREEYVASSVLVESEPYRRLGLSDAAINRVADLPAFILTVDLDLFVYLTRREAPVANFNHLRVSGWR